MSGATLRERLHQPGILVVPGAYDALTARLVEEAGFPAVYATGAGIANSQFALADVGLVSFGEMLQQVARITAAVSIPVIVDADTGYGDTPNVTRTVKELARLGVAAIQLEDQAEPKRCGHFAGKRVVSPAEMVGRLRAALDARPGPDPLIIARTDARAELGLEEALARARTYAEVGAEVTFVEAPRSREELARIPRELPVPQLVNMVEGGLTPLLPARELETMGYRILLHANAALRASVKAVQRVLAVLAAQGTTAGCLSDLITMEERNRITRLAELEVLADKYRAPA
ncbi:MAG: isocitrate lyase/PEP mutase family protein [Deltaproteobacteria bacterium]|nr:isocitrate lyase/PEP mutase family protein [Deltaproteobacteria bacterium]